MARCACDQIEWSLHHICLLQDGTQLGLAILQDLFIDFGKEGEYTTWEDNEVAVTGNTAITARGHTIGWEYYGTFLRALYTLFQVFTGESWSEAVARPLVFGLYKSNAVFVSFFFVSFIILTQVCMRP